MWPLQLCLLSPQELLLWERNMVRSCRLDWFMLVHDGSWVSNESSCHCLQSPCGLQVVCVLIFGDPAVKHISGQAGHKNSQLHRTGNGFLGEEMRAFRRNSCKSGRLPNAIAIQNMDKRLEQQPHTVYCNSLKISTLVFDFPHDFGF